MAGKFALRHVVGSDVVNELMSENMRQSQSMSQGVMLSFDFPMAARTVRRGPSTQGRRPEFEVGDETEVQEEEEYEVQDDAALSLVMMGLLRKAINAKNAKSFTQVGGDPDDSSRLRHASTNSEWGCGKEIVGVRELSSNAAMDSNNETLQSFSDVGEKVVDLVWRKVSPRLGLAQTEGGVYTLYQLDEKKEGKINFETFSRVLFAQPSSQDAMSPTSVFRITTNGWKPGWRSDEFDGDDDDGDVDKFDVDVYDDDDGDDDVIHCSKLRRGESSKGDRLNKSNVVTYVQNSDGTLTLFLLHQSLEEESNNKSQQGNTEILITFAKVVTLSAAESSTYWYKGAIQSKNYNLEEKKKVPGLPWKPMQ
eukprot:765730-Hanusia_phi.AAC.1